MWQLSQMHCARGWCSLMWVTVLAWHDFQGWDVKIAEVNSIATHKLAPSGHRGTTVLFSVSQPPVLYLSSASWCSQGKQGLEVVCLSENVLKPVPFIPLTPFPGLQSVFLVFKRFSFPLPYVQKGISWLAMHLEATTLGKGCVMRECSSLWGEEIILLIFLSSVKLSWCLQRWKTKLTVFQIKLLDHLNCKVKK